MPITLADMKGLTPGGKVAILTHIVELAPTMLPAHGISTALRVCHFLAQCAHESAGFRTTEEYATGKAYEGRKDLGNTAPGDGVRYKGRGLIQTTGKRNYWVFSKWASNIDPDTPDFVMTPDKLGEFPWALLSAVYYWESHSLSSLADKNDLKQITHIVNGGYNGYDSRRDYFNKAWRAIGRRLEAEAVEVV